MNSWFLLALAILLEVAGTTSMKLSDGMQKLWPTVLIFLFYALAFTLMPFVMKKIEMSTVYAIWTGAGTVIVTLIGIMYFSESSNPMKLASIALIGAGVVGLHLAERSVEGGIG
jgi:small multidrug resistance pump